jgi:hypothetical protein
VIGRSMNRRNRAGILASLAAGLLLALPARAAAQGGDDHQDQHDQPAGPGPELFVRAFGSVEWGASELPSLPNSFALGQFALFVTSALNDHVSVLAEIVMEASGANTQVVTDLERLQVTFRLDDHLRVSAGRYHTGIGFYNAAFHHGSYFETPIGRPRVFAFEDEGGVLPVHEVGLSARGMVPKTGAALHYVAEVGNGRSWETAAAGTEGRDQNRSKSTNVGLSLRPEAWRGVEVGTSFYRDNIPNATLNNVAHRIGTAYAVYRTPTVEVMAEWLRLTHQTLDGRHFVNQAGYAQVSHAFGKLRPYYRFDRLAIDTATPFIGNLGSYKANVFGVRIDPAEWIGLKAQYERTDELGRFGVNAVRTQLVFVF